ncbi:glycosyl hydrolase [Paenibacillus soyae]|uniref:Glycosyl hydrolase n=1 Tax=Paenibacillus soyae TaxID=2969249 RepID=A0A9X2MUU3_9BACL|nr:glycosyl hydrolase [Paenibacillus soyae]MCR2806266.1 glycosyl hydrolase [Paenibacillus soyae]
MFMRETFKSPENRYRPKMRWWLPGAYMENDEIKREIEWLANAGYGGAEIIHFFGIPTEDVEPEQYVRYGFGSDEWNDRMKAALETAIPLGFQLDFTIGPLWPIATPAIMDREDDRCVHGLHFGTRAIIGAYHGQIPGAETIDGERPRKLVAVTAARLYNGAATIGKAATLDLESAIDLMKAGCVDILTERIAWSPPDDGEWYLFAFWSQTNGQMNDSISAPVVDHFSKDAVDAITGYWDERLLGDPYLRMLYEKNAGCLFCDSIELNATMLGGMYGAKPLAVSIWTPELLREFRERRGYDLTPYLPSIFIKGLYQLSVRNADEDAEFDFEDRSANRRIRNDFHLTLTEMFRDNHVRVLREWANRHNMRLRYQTYGLPTELTNGLLEVDIPETESLGFKDSTDGYRLQSGAVHMKNLEMYSIEVGAVMGFGYKQTWTGKEYGLLWQLHRGFASGVNQAVLHGMSYESTSASGHFRDMFKWPGMSLMGSMFSNEWGARQPISRHSRGIADYIARNQYVLRMGKAKVDLAIYRYHIDGIHHDILTEPTVYEQAGYSYDYVSPALLNLETAKVGMFDGQPVLDADGSAYKTLIVDTRVHSDGSWRWSPYMPLDIADRLLEYAKEGLPIVLVGEGASGVLSYNGDYNVMEREDDELRQKLERLRTMPNVRHVPNQEGVVEALRKLSVLPAVRTPASSPLIALRRYDQGDNYYYVYNSSLKSEFQGEVVVGGRGRAYLLDAWDGSVYPLEAESAPDGEVAIPLRLAANESALVLVTPLDLGESEEKLKMTPSDNPNILQLDNWTLTVNSWTPGSVPFETRIEKIELELGEGLKDWTDIPQLENKSGIGCYRTSFVLSESEERLPEAILQIGQLSDTFRIQVNGTPLHAVNQIDRRVRIGKWLKTGVNLIEIEVATTLNNALLKLDPHRKPEPHGLVGPVQLLY